MQDEYTGNPEISEVSWTLDNTAVYGTIVKPAGEGPFPAVVMVAGSGPTDRDWNTPLLPGTNGSATLIAEALAEHGFASIRYDKRASGPHAQDNMQKLMGKISLQGHRDELAGAVLTIAAHPYVNRSKIFALTSSEGALHVLHYQNHQPEIPFAALILTGAPGRAVADVARSQIAAQLAPVPGGEQILASYDEAIDRFAAGEPMNPDPTLPQGILMLLQSIENPINMPFSRELWQANAAEWLKDVNVPVLVVIGKKDIQVDWQADGQPLQQAAAGHDDVTFIFPENSNHVLKYEPKPREEINPAEVAASYNGPDTKLDEEALRAILDWLREHI